MLTREYTKITKQRFNLSGAVFGRLRAERLLGSWKNQHYWLCTCECGNKVEVRSRDLRSGHSRSCGCLSAEMSRNARRGVPAKESIGITYGSLTVVEILPKSGGYWCVAKCGCGGTWKGRIASLREGTTKSCGCEDKARRIKHG